MVARPIPWRGPSKPPRAPIPRSVGRAPRSIRPCRPPSVPTAAPPPSRPPDMPDRPPAAPSGPAPPVGACVAPAAAPVGARAAPPAAVPDRDPPPGAAVPAPPPPDPAAPDGAPDAAPLGAAPGVAPPPGAPAPGAVCAQTKAALPRRQLAASAGNVRCRKAIEVSSGACCAAFPLRHERERRRAVPRSPRSRPMKNLRGELAGPRCGPAALSAA